jgi:hypothetical protein
VEGHAADLEGGIVLRRLLILLVLGSLVLTACGGDDGGAGDEGGTTGDVAADTGADAGEDGDGDVGAIDAARCAEVTAAMAAAANAVPQAFSGGGADLEASVEQLEAFAEAAPEEIRDDLLTIAEGYAKVIQAFADADFDPTSGEAPPPEVIAALEEATQQIDSGEFQAAADRVNAWFEEECGA